jgi:hypothetical protein
MRRYSFYGVPALLFYEVIMARAGMTAIIQDLRDMTEAGAADWTTTGGTFFADDMLQTILDRHVESFVFRGMESEEPVKISDGTFQWSVYELEGLEHIEASTGGTAIFYIQENTGGTVAAASYSMDYRRGVMTLTTPLTLATPYFATGYSYDLNGAAADVWRTKANHAASSFKWSTDNHSVDKTSVYKQYMQMADYYLGLSNEGGGGSGDMTRKDTDQC